MPKSTGPPLCDSNAPSPTPFLRLVRHSRSLGIDVRTDADVSAIERNGDAYRVHARTPGGDASIDADMVVHGAGRIPNTAHLALSDGHVDADERRGVHVNEYLQSVS